MRKTLSQLIEEKRQQQENNKPMHTIPIINFELSIENYYNFLKNHKPGFSWSIILLAKDLTHLQKDLLEFFVEQQKKNHLTRIDITFWCTKIGKIEQKTVGIEKITKVPFASGEGFKIEDNY